ncbi:Crp/Fnr family transcriptional regulator [Scleromatobacter humisilvae]|uniref:Crp/Fnr family transcriptional regulator n=1 Tax=Scleromatobacter humisilvae TaxID=2897159 RepID=A0A9X1YI15_9BURK|nr:Crp/Fnr family transcriptional regulator [Scleromatobacter humisilvae]MCK9686714.1 Crp/Fnr family transcriptional regulator [Scleromatobacter humisilvae]
MPTANISWACRATIRPAPTCGGTEAMTQAVQGAVSVLRRSIEAPPLPAMTPLLGELAACGLMRRYRKGTVLIEEGDQGDALYIIMAGRLRAFSSAANGREITFGIYGPGEYLGEMSLDGGPRCASVETIEASLCSVVRRETLDRFIDEHPAFAFELLTKVIRRARAATLSAKNLALNSVYGSLKQLLESASSPRADGTAVVGERLTHRDLANRIGCSREMVSRVMKDLETGQYVRQQEGRLIIAHPLPIRW